MTLADIMAMAGRNPSPQARADALALIGFLPPTDQLRLMAVATDPAEIPARAALHRFARSTDQLAEAIKPVPPSRASTPAMRALHDALAALRQHVGIVAALGGQDADAMAAVADHLDDAMVAVMEAQS